MLLSIYTSVRNGLFYDYHVVDMINIVALGGRDHRQRRLFNGRDL